jgi:hypothetical protein
MRFVTDLSKGILGKPDSYELWESILSQYPDEFFFRDDLKILSPACGHATEVDVVVKRMIKLGIPADKIKNSIYLVDKYKVFTKDAIRKGYTNVFKADFLDWNPGMKFDAVIGNPPYQGTNKVSDDRTQPKNHNLWTKFIHKSFNELVKDEGYVSFVTPDSWMSPSNDVFKLFKENQVHYVDLDCGQYFNVGSSFTAWTAQKIPVTKETSFGKVSVNLKEFPYLPRDLERTLSIHKKVINYTDTKIPVLGDITCHSSKDVVSKKKSDEFSYPMLHTNAQTRWSKIKSKYYNDIKVMWTLSGYYKPQINLGDKGFTEVNQAIIVNTKEEADAVFSYMNSKLYHFIVTTAKWSGFLNGKVFSMLPDLGKNKVYTDKEIYQIFDLTDKEIEIVESYN